MRNTISATGENFGHFESESAILSWNSRFSSGFVKIQGFQGRLAALLQSLDPANLAKRPNMVTAMSY